MPTFRSARECLYAIESRYRTLQCYADEGVVRPVAPHAHASCQFETWFAQPDKFCFRFSKPHPYPPLRHLVLNTTVGANGKHAYIRMEPPSGEPIVNAVEDVAMAIASATGISHRAAYTIGHLLFESAAGTAFSDFLRPRFRRARLFDGVPCQRVSARHPRGGLYTLWFGAEDLLLRKVVCHRNRSEEIRRHIEANQDIREDVF